MNDHTESLIREAFAAEADRAPDPRPVLAALAGGGRRRGPMITAISLGAVVIAVAVAVVVPQVVRDPAGAGPSAGSGQPAATDRDVLLVGLDSAGLADSIMLAHLGADGDAAALSLPRDTWVAVPGGGHKRLNTVERDLGTPALLELVGDLTGVTVDHYAILPMASFGPISEAVGGVPVCLLAAKSDPFSGASLPAGRQLVRGADALAFLRQRHGLEGSELDRMRRLQAFVHGLATKIADGQADLRAILETVARTARLDPDWDLPGMADQLRSVRPERLRLGTIPVREDPALSGRFVVDPVTVRAWVDQAINGGGPSADNLPHPPASPGRPGPMCVD